MSIHWRGVPALATAVLADTGPLYAANYSSDQYHERAQEQLHSSAHRVLRYSSYTGEGGLSHGLAGWERGMAVAASKRYAIDDLAQFPDDGKLRELSDGRLVEWDVTSYRHGLLAGLLAHLLIAFVRQHRLGSVTITDTMIRTSGGDHDTRGGDIAFFARGRRPRDPDAAVSDVTPDFVIEVFSPSDRAGEVQAKVRDWLRAGVRLLWYVEPESGVTTVYRGNVGTFVGPDEELSGEDVVPGFTLRLGHVLAELAADEAADAPGAASERGE